MSHWAEIDEKNIVLRVIVGDNNDPNDDEGYQWIVNNLGGRWIKTSYNSNIRKNYAGIGFIYDEQKDAFIAPKPYPSWVLNEDTCKWESSISYPKDNKEYYWDEDLLNWIEIPN
jgi:hypothetical protein